MTFQINEFRSELASKTGGYLRHYEYQVSIAPPPALSGSKFVNQNQQTTGENVQNMISLRATQARLPTAQLEWLDIPRYGLGLRQGAPYNAHIQQVQIAFILDKLGNLYNFFHSWLNYIFAYSTKTDAQGGGVANQTRANYLVNYKDQYVTDIHLKLYDTIGKLSMEFVMLQAFPVMITQIPLDWEQTKSLVEMTVVFNYRDYSLTTSNLGQGQLNTDLTSPPSSSIPNRNILINQG